MTLFDLDGQEEKDEKDAGALGELPSDLPLAARIRPRDFSEFVGQEHLLGKGRVLRKSIEADQLPSMILWARRAAARRL